MRLGVLADTHDELSRTGPQSRCCVLVELRRLIHCGDLASPPIVAACAVLPCWFVFGNHDSDWVPALQQALRRVRCSLFRMGRGCHHCRQASRGGARAHVDRHTASLGGMPCLPVVWALAHGKRCGCRLRATDQPRCAASGRRVHCRDLGCSIWIAGVSAGHALADQRNRALYTRIRLRWSDGFLAGES